MKQYNKSNIPLAKDLRKNMTPWERKLWYDFLRSYPVRFQRQKAIGNFIVDFYCAKARLVIELDGGGHYETAQIQKDIVRDDILTEMGLSVLRICNLDVDQNFRGVCEMIDLEVQSSLPQSASLTAPSSEGAGQSTIFALGFFDGVHRGHQALLAGCRELAKQCNALSAAITFDRHPQSLFTDTPPALINNAADRRRLLQHFGMAAVYDLPVTKEVMSTPWEAFLEQLVSKNAVGFVCGEDFRFGHKGEGNARKLEAFCRERGLSCAVIPEQTLDGIRVSSTHIRQLLAAGNMAAANRFLGHPHILTGEVVCGQKLGRTIGVPTANISLEAGILIPKFGVYACKVHLDGKAFLGVTNIGNRPTVAGKTVTVEPWILDFEGDLYHRSLTLEFHDFLRPEQKFDSLDALRQEILRNAEQTRQLLG